MHGKTLNMFQIEIFPMKTIYMDKKKSIRKYNFSIEFLETSGILS